MSKIKSKSSIEKIPKEYRGLYMRRHPSGIFGSPDFGNKSRRVMLFIDGCFWHKCPRHYRAPKSNRGYWLSKIVANVKRDKRVNFELRRRGYTVVRVWECELDFLK